MSTFAIVHVKTRYRIQILPVFSLSSAVILATPGGLPGNGTRAAAAFCAVVLTLLAFGGAWLP